MATTQQQLAALAESVRTTEHIRRIVKFLEEHEEVVDGMRDLINEYFLLQKIDPSTPLSRAYRDIQRLVALAMIAQSESTVARMRPYQPTWRVGQP